MIISLADDGDNGSAEAEYRGVANVVAETAWLHNLLRELHSPLSTCALEGDQHRCLGVGMNEVEVKVLSGTGMYYFMYGHVEKQKVAESVEGVEAKLWQVPEILSEEVLKKMSAPPKSDVPIITPNELGEGRWIHFWSPNNIRHDGWSIQDPETVKSLNKLTALTQLVHHGMIFVPIGYSFGDGMSEMGELKGGSPYGAGTFSGDGSRQPSKLELEQAFHQGKYIATITKKLKGIA
ncbi:NAD(P)H dehydrogenase (quinone) FQR1 [Tanacetum coccineum]